MAWKRYKPEEIVAKANCNVRYWLLADIMGYPSACPLLGVKRTWGAFQILPKVTSVRSHTCEAPASRG